MNLVDAYKALGYRLANPRQDWSAESDHGVCIALWKDEIAWTPLPPSFDCYALWPADMPDPTRAGHKKRLRHLDRAEREFGGKVDVVILRGKPGEGYGEADPWERPGSIWRISSLDRTSGKFRAAVELVK